jgi:hypothetical protein
MSKYIFDRQIYNIILVHVSRTWERVRLEQPNEEMPLDNIGSAYEMSAIADYVIRMEIVQEFLLNRDGSIWDTYGDKFSDVYIERVSREYIQRNYI